MVRPGGKIGVGVFLKLNKPELRLPELAGCKDLLAMAYTGLLRQSRLGNSFCREGVEAIQIASWQTLRRAAEIGGAAYVLRGSLMRIPLAMACNNDVHMWHEQYVNRHGDYSLRRSGAVYAH